MKKYLLKRRKVVEYKGSLLGFSIEFEKSHRRIRFRKIGQFTISTVFLGFAHKDLFETMVFDKDLNVVSQVRASTHRESLKLHQEAIAKVKQLKK